MGRSPCCDNNGVKKGPWTPQEQEKLIHYIHLHGPGSWRTLPKHAGLQRCGKSCRLRWTNYLRPGIKRGGFCFEEEDTIIQLHSLLGNKWSVIAAHLPGRTDNEIKNYWNTHIQKRLLRMGIDPNTHGPRLNVRDYLSLVMGSSSSSVGLQQVTNLETQLFNLIHQNQNQNENEFQIPTPTLNYDQYPADDSLPIIMSSILNPTILEDSNQYINFEGGVIEQAGYENWWNNNQNLYWFHSLQLTAQMNPPGDTDGEYGNSLNFEVLDADGCLDISHFL